MSLGLPLTFDRSGGERGSQQLDDVYIDVWFARFALISQDSFGILVDS